MLRFSLVFLSTVLVLGVPATAWGHPGHGSVEAGPAHYVMEPLHAFSIVGAIVLGIVFATWLVSSKMLQSTSDS